MEPIAAAAVAVWNKRRNNDHKRRGLLCVSFDQRNHGVREVASLANEDWRSGNPRHAQDMFSIFQGTAVDTSILISYLPAYVFPHNEHEITSNLVLGVSLGGHAAWHCVLHDHRIDTAIVIIGCADYARLMSQRADKSKLETWRASDPPGSNFIGSKDFPRALQEAVDKLDPAALLMGEMIQPGGNDYTREPTEREKKRLMPLMRDHLQGKRIFNVAGGADKLVPYSCSEPFMQWVKNAVQPGSWYANKEVVVKDKTYEGVGHEVSPEMMRDSLDFIMEALCTDKAVVAKI